MSACWAPSRRRRSQCAARAPSGLPLAPPCQHVQTQARLSALKADQDQDKRGAAPQLTTQPRVRRSRLSLVGPLWQW